jgi:putative SOS response-associated peptidase YedK
MCGRYVIKLLSQIDQALGIQRGSWQINDNFRVMPTDTVPVVRSSEGLREASMMRWGLIPFSAHGVPPKLAWINARSETLSETFPWKEPWTRQQRCILPAAGFYEPHLNEDGSKQPFYIHLVDREIFGMAGLWERSFKADGTEVLSCTIIMQPANRLMAEVHNEKKRMPSVLAREDHDAWLSGSPAEAQAVLRQYPDDLMAAYSVSSRVNS